MLEARLLGQFEIQLDGSKIELAARPAQSLLAWLLLTAGTAHRRERLAGIFWPDSEETSARRNLRQTLWQIRRAFGAASDNFLRVDDFTIAFDGQADYWLDAAVIARPVEASTTIVDLSAAVQAYCGELLPGFYDDWVQLERERLQAQFERKMQLLLDRLVESRRWEEVLRWGEHWIAQGSAPEPAYRSLMHAHAALGDSAKVAEIYRRCSEALQRDLAVEPSQQTRALYEQLRKGNHAASPIAAPETAPSTLRIPPGQTLPSALVPTHNLPNQVTSFIGRSKELAEIQRLLDPTSTSATVRLLTLTGPGGTGKTRLAVQAVQPLLTHFSDGIWLVELATIADPALIAQLVAALLNVSEESSRPLLDSLIDALRDRRLLLLLDNCEHLIEPVAQFVATLLRFCPQVRVLTTSRETLGMSGESVLRVPSLSTPIIQPGQPLAEIVNCEAVCLFLDRAKTVAPTFALAESNVTAISQICRQLDGIPLAIELAAARVRAMSVDQIAARLDDRFRLLTGGNRAALPRQQTLRATMDWSWDLLTEAERALLRRLAVFIDGWTLDAAEEVCTWEGGAVTLAVNDLLDLLTHLVEKSLVQMEQTTHPYLGEGVRYHLLETIRQYASDKLVTAGEAETARSHHLAYFWQLAADADPRLRSADQLIWLARLDLEHDNLRAALNWSLSSNSLAAGLGIAGNLARYWYLRGYWKEGRDWLHLLLQAPGAPALAQANPYLAARGKAFYGLGWLAYEDGSEEAFYRESLALCQRVGDRWGEAFSLRGLFSVSDRYQDEPAVQEARQRLYESLTIFQTLSDHWGMALANFTLGWFAFTRFQLEEAETHWQTAQQLFHLNGDRWGIAVTLNALSTAARRAGDYTRAETLTKEALTHFRNLGDKAGVANAILRLSNVDFRRGDYHTALVMAEKSLRMERERNAPAGVLTALQVEGLIACMQGDFVHGIAHLEESVKLAEERDAQSDRADSLGFLAQAYYHSNDLDRAAATLQKTLFYYQQAGDRAGIGIAQHGAGLVALKQGDLVVANQCLQESLATFRRWQDQQYIATGLYAQAQLAQRLGDRAAALAYGQESLQLRQKMGDQRGIAESLEQIAGCLEDPATAVQRVASADALRQRIGAPVLPVERAEYDQLLSRLRQQLGEVDFATQWEQGGVLTVAEVLGEEGELSIINN